ncbi:MAG TPA: two-component regulator propeller domain-containing protein [Candidatus Acidoferrales bacterium]|nr:two-component regulator propeller domain-containing protein [Candidatus Acidoferrales bacterium]
MIGRHVKWPLVLAIWACAGVTQAVVLWSDFGTTLVHNSGNGYDILNGAVKEDDSSTNTLYFKFRVDPLSDASTEEYFAAFELYDGEKERLGIGNALKAWAYSAFRADATGQSDEGSDYIDLHSSRPESSTPGTSIIYENPHRGIPCTLVFKVQFIPGGNDVVTVWLNPDLGPGATEAAQPESLITRFKADATFNEIHLRHGGGGDGWIFSDMAIATSFADFVAMNENKPVPAAGGAVNESALFTFRRWQSEQGLPQDRVRALAQTVNGYIWVGTDDGLARFDGARFVSFGLPDGLPNSPVRTLYGDSHGSLWIGSVGDGLIHWQAGHATMFTMANGLPSDAISTLAEDSEGRIWIGTDSGLAIWHDGRLMNFEAAKEFVGKAITSLCKDRQGNMWVGATGAGIFEYRDGAFVPLEDSAIRELLQDPHCILVDKAGRIWIGAGDDFVLCRDGNQWRPYRIPRHLARSYISSMAEQSDGTVWAGSTSEGLFEFKDRKMTVVNASSGLSDNSVESLLADRDGNLWAGTDTGLNLLRQRDLFAFDQRQGLGYGGVDGMAEIAPGQVWVGKPGDGVYEWDGQSFSHVMSADLSVVGPQINVLLKSKNGGCWVAGKFGLLYFKRPEKTADKALLFTLPGLNIISLCEAANGALWVGTSEGKLFRLENDTWQEQTGLNHPLTALAAAADGSVWVGTEGDGIYQFSGGKTAHWNTKNGLLSDLVRALYVDSDQSLWIGTAGGGLSCLRLGIITTVTTREGLPDNTISEILDDEKGRLWLGNNRGIACLNKEELQELIAGKITAVYPQVFGRAEGMLSEECAGGFCPAGLKTASGRLWFPTLKGLVVVDPAVRLSKLPRPAVLLEQISVDGVPHSVFAMSVSPSGERDPDFAGTTNGVLNLGPGRHRIEFQYTALGFDSPERIRFRYRLHGLDSDWAEAGNRRLAFYSYVPPGSYWFQVIACNADGLWNDTGATIGLTVAKFFWQTWWFTGLLSATLLVLVGAGVRFIVKRNLQRRLKHLEQERVLERERTRIAQDLHDEMGAKLCRISFLSEHVRRNQNGMAPELRHQIASISDASREVLHSLDEIVWAVNPQNDTLEHVVSYIGHYANEFFQETGIECKVNISGRPPPYSLSAQLRHNLLLAVNEAFTNVLKHSKANQVDVSIDLNADTFEATVSDNGNGFDLSSTVVSESSSGAAGDGLRNMKQRLSDIGGRCSIQSKPGNGTVVQFVLPLVRLKNEKDSVTP